MFMVTHKARKLGKLCQDWKREMRQISEQVRRGEVNYTPEEIYAMVVDPRRIGAKRARKLKVAARFSVYEKNEAQMVALQEQLDSEKKKVAKQDKEILKLQKRERNLREYLNDALKTLGCQPVPDDSEDESQDEGEHEVDNPFTWDDVQEDENYAGNDYDLEEDENYAGDDNDLQAGGCADDNHENELSGEDD